jgi:lysozyme
MKMRGQFIMTLFTLLLWACSTVDPVPHVGAQDVVKRRAMMVTHPDFADVDAHEDVGSIPRRYPIHGIDVSRWQGDIDWQEARASGIAFAFIKATEGGDLLDPMFQTYWNGARNAGVHHGAYHYFYFCRSAKEQARWFIQHVPRDPTALPPVLDMEWNHKSPTCQLRPSGAQVRAEAKLFLDILESHYGRRPLVYTTVDFFRDTKIGELENTHFWFRSVAGHPEEIYLGEDWMFWQYTGTGVVPGVRVPVDINVFAGSLEQWRKWTN